jgi:hypothetical protein
MVSALIGIPSRIRFPGIHIEFTQEIR